MILFLYLLAIFLIVLLILCTIYLVYITIWSSIAIVNGAPYVPTDEKTLQIMLDLAAIKKDDRVVDLGSGDGQLVIESANRGAMATGIEINPSLVRKSRIRIAKAGLNLKATIVLGNFKKMDLSSYNVVFVYGISYLMKPLEKQLLQQLKPGVRVISNYYRFPTWKPNRKKGIVYRYIKT